MRWMIEQSDDYLAHANNRVNRRKFRSKPGRVSERERYNTARVMSDDNYEGVRNLVEMPSRITKMSYAPADTTDRRLNSALMTAFNLNNKGVRSANFAAVMGPTMEGAKFTMDDFAMVGMDRRCLGGGYTVTYNTGRQEKIEIGKPSRTPSWDPQTKQVIN